MKSKEINKEIKTCIFVENLLISYLIKFIFYKILRNILDN